MPLIGTAAANVLVRSYNNLKGKTQDEQYSLFKFLNKILYERMEIFESPEAMLAHAKNLPLTIQ